MSNHPIDYLIEGINDPDHQAILGLAKYDGLSILISYAQKALNEALIIFPNAVVSMPVERFKSVLNAPETVHNSKTFIVHAVLRVKNEVFQEINGKVPPDTRFETQEGMLSAWYAGNEWEALCKAHKVYCQVEYVEYSGEEPYCAWQALCDLSLSFKRPEIISQYHYDLVDNSAIYALQRDWKMEMGRHNKGKQEAHGITYRVNPVSSKTEEVTLYFKDW